MEKASTREEIRRQRSKKGNNERHKERKEKASYSQKRVADKERREDRKHRRERKQERIGRWMQDSTE